MADSKDISSVRQVLKEHREQITSDYHAEGTGIGKKEPNSQEYVIVVYVKEKTLIPAGPVSIEGISLQFAVTGKFRPQTL